jgi:hypothetical protein
MRNMRNDGAHEAAKRVRRYSVVKCRVPDSRSDCELPINLCNAIETYDTIDVEQVPRPSHAQCHGG